MFFARSEELRAALKFVSAGISVSVVAADGSGRTSFLKQIRDAAENRAFSTIWLAGSPSKQQRPFEALEMANLLERTGSAVHMGRTVEALAEQFASRKSLLLVDDAHFVDSQSWAVLAALHARTAVPVVSASRPSAKSFGLESVTAFAAEVQLRPLSYQAVSDMIHDLLGASADTELISRVYTKSAGIPSLVSAMVGVARGFDRIAPVNGTWVTQGDLWHEALAGAVTHLLAGLDDRALESLEILALAGTIDVRTARDLVGDTVLEMLEAHKLLLEIEPFGRLSVAVTPPLISEFFQNKPPSLRRTRLLERVQNLFDSDQRAAEVLPPTWSLPADRSDSLFDSRTAETALLRLIRDRHAAQVATCRHAWDDDRSVATAVAFLDVLMEGPRDNRVVADVFARTFDTSGDATARIEYAIHKARWLATTQPSRFEAAVRVLEECARAFPEGRDLLNSWALQLEVLDRGVPSDIESRFATASPGSTHWNSTVAARSSALIVSGNPLAATRLLARADQPESTRVGNILELMRCWALLGCNDVEGAYARASTKREQARIDLDIDSLREFSYVAAVACITLGQFQNAEGLLSGLLALGEPGLGQERTYLGALVLSALLAARNGRSQVARSLAKQARSTGIDYGPFPGMFGILPQILFDVIDGNEEAATTKLAKASRDLLSKGYAFTLAFTVLVDTPGIGAAVVETLRPRMADFDGALLQSFVELYDAIDAGRADKLELIAKQLLSEGRRSQAQTAVEEAIRISDDSTDQANKAHLVKLLKSIQKGRPANDTRHYYSQSSSQATLSNRELEVARLAASGLSNQHIADQLGVSSRTIESHILKIFRKLHISARTQLAEQPWF